MTTQLTTARTNVTKSLKRNLLILAFVGLTLIIGACTEVPVVRTEAAGQAVVDQAFDTDAARYEAMAEFAAETAEHPSHLTAANPELSVAQRYVPIDPATNDRPGLDIEVIRHNNYTANREASDEDLGESYFKDWGIEADAIDQAGSIIRTPVNFDTAALKQTYFDDWTVEADTVDRIDQPAVTDIELLRHNYLTVARIAVVAIPQPPAEFDLDHVEQTYFADWAVEADLSDPVVQPIIDEVETMLQRHFDRLRQANVVLVDGNATAGPLNLDESDISALRQSYFETWQPEADRSDISPIATIDFEKIDKAVLHRNYFKDLGR